MDRPVTIHEMASAATGPDFTLDLGNSMDIPDANDSLGLGMLANMGRQRGNSQGAPPPPPPPTQPRFYSGLAAGEN
jgi:hypothetical protein